MKPYEALPTSVRYGGRVYDLNLSYGAFYAALDALNDPRLLDGVKLSTALDLLVESPHPVDPGLLGAVVALIRDHRPHGDQRKLLDVEQDWGYICAAFLQVYGIDLYQDKTMHIMQFRALLESLPKNTKIADIVTIRGAEIPELNQHNAKQVAELTRLKALYALQYPGGNIQDGWARMFNALSARAVNRNA